MTVVGALDEGVIDEPEWCLSVFLSVRCAAVIAEKCACVRACAAA
jgi:hypothetical protein